MIKYEIYYLEKAVHARFEKEIVDGIEIHVAGRGGGREERRPVPAVVLGVQQEVCADNRHAHCHCTQNTQYFRQGFEMSLNFKAKLVFCARYQNGS